MKYIKTYESDNSIKPKIGDYVHIFNESDEVEQDFHDFFKKNIGQIINIKDENNIYDITVKFKKVPKKLVSYNKHNNNKYNYGLKSIENSNNATWFIFNDDIIDFAPTIEELKLKIAARKYNL